MQLIHQRPSSECLSWACMPCNKSSYLVAWLSRRDVLNVVKGKDWRDLCCRNLLRDWEWYRGVKKSCVYVCCPDFFEDSSPSLEPCHARGGQALIFQAITIILNLWVLRRFWQNVIFRVFGKKKCACQWPWFSEIDQNLPKFVVVFSMLFGSF